MFTGERDGDLRNAFQKMSGRCQGMLLYKNQSQLQLIPFIQFPVIRIKTGIPVFNDSAKRNHQEVHFGFHVDFA